MKPSSDSTSRSNHRGFTLVELLVVILIIAVLAAISMFTVGKFKRQANSVKAIQSMQQIGSAVLGLAAEQGGRLPGGGGYPKPSANPPILNDTSWDWFVLRFLEVSEQDAKPTTPPKINTAWENTFYHPNDNTKPITTANYPTARRTFVMLGDLTAGTGSTEYGQNVSSIKDTKTGAFGNPSRTALLGEHPWRTDGRNRVGFRSASFMDINALVPDPQTGKDLNPGGKWNFVFVDGHVETLTKKESLGKGSVAKVGGVWTIDPND